MRFRIALLPDDCPATNERMGEPKMTSLAKRFLAAAAFSAAMALPQAGNAQIINFYDLDLVTAPVVVPLQHFIPNDLLLGPQFVDIWQFDLTPDSLIESVLLTINTADSALTIDPATFISVMHDSADNIVAGALNFNGITNALSWIPFQPLAAGLDYQLRVAGVLTGNFGGGYSGHLAAVPLIPEPETYALLLAGLGLLGFVARRRGLALRTA
jgi:hypothetical protein